MNNKNNFQQGGFSPLWFTLVELIVVITILAILSTIGFVSYSSYLSWTRDWNRIAQLKSISEWLHLYSTNHSLPTPDTTSTSIMDNWTQIATQWYAWKNVLETITYSTEWVDPKDKTYFSYYLTKDKKYFQLMAFLEEEDNLQNTAVWVDYSTRYPTVFWNKLWILTTGTNEPIQVSLETIDIWSNLAEEYISHLKDWDSVSWNWTTFSILTNIAKVWGKFCSSDNLECIDPSTVVCWYNNLGDFVLVNEKLWSVDEYFVQCLADRTDWIKWEYLNPSNQVKKQFKISNTAWEPSWDWSKYNYVGIWWSNEYPAFTYCTDKWENWRLPTWAEMQSIVLSSWWSWYEWHTNLESIYGSTGYFSWTEYDSIYAMEGRFYFWNYTYNNKTSSLYIICVHD